MTKIFVKILTICALALLLPLTASATGDYHVWIDTGQLTPENGSLQVTIYSDGTTADGLLELSYDTSVLTCDPTTIIAADGVDMYSANTPEAGLLKIAYLADEAITEGVLFTVPFTLEGTAVSAESLSVKGDVHNEKGEALTVGLKASPEDIPIPPSEDLPEEDINNNENADKNENPNTDKNTNANGTVSVNTGDHSFLVLWIAAAAVALPGFTAVLSLRRRR